MSLSKIAITMVSTHSIENIDDTRILEPIEKGCSLVQVQSPFQKAGGLKSDTFSYKWNQFKEKVTSTRKSTVRQIKDAGKHILKEHPLEAAAFTTFIPGSAAFTWGLAGSWMKARDKKKHRAEEQLREQREQLREQRAQDCQKQDLEAIKNWLQDKFNKGNLGSKSREDHWEVYSKQPAFLGLDVADRNQVESLFVKEFDILVESEADRWVNALDYDAFKKIFLTADRDMQSITTLQEYQEFAKLKKDLPDVNAIRDEQCFRALRRRYIQQLTNDKNNYSNYKFSKTGTEKLERLITKHRNELEAGKAICEQNRKNMQTLKISLEKTKLGLSEKQAPGIVKQYGQMIEKLDLAMNQLQE